MSGKRRGLKIGLDELLSATLDQPFTEDKLNSPVAEKKSEYQHLPIEHLKPSKFQPRQRISHEGIEQLSESIRSQGIIQPIVARAVKGTDQFEIIAGERRWRAAQLAGLDKVPVLVKELSDEVSLTIALIENIQREDLNTVEEAKALKRLSDDLGLTHLQVAEALGKSRASVTNLIRLLALNEDVLAYLEQGQIDMGHARALLALKGSMQSQVARTIVSRGLTVRETERVIQKLQEGQIHSKKKEERTDPNIRRLEEDLADKLGAAVAIKHSSRKGQGSVVIQYSDVDELEGILAHFK